MMTSSNGNIFRFTAPLWEESIGHRWIRPTKASDEELWSFLWSAPEQTVVIWDVIALIMTSLWWTFYGWQKSGYIYMQAGIYNGFDLNCRTGHFSSAKLHEENRMSTVVVTRKLLELK